METGAAYLISVGIAAFGAWVVAGAIAAGSPLAWVLGGLVTVAIGSFSLFLQCKRPRLEAPG
jgi:hypothetical protein